MIYTKNLDIIYHNCQKAYIYYIEFIGQIGDDNHSFLQLNSKDAALFVYKKTIFEINNDARKDFVSDIIADKLINTVDLLIKIYNILLMQLIDNNTLIDVIKIVNTELNIVMQKVIKITMEPNDNKVQSILIFTSYFKKENLLDNLDIFIKKIKKKSTIDLTKLTRSLLEDETSDIIITPKYVTNLVSQL